MVLSSIGLNTILPICKTHNHSNIFFTQEQNRIRIMECTPISNKSTTFEPGLAKKCLQLWQTIIKVYFYDCWHNWFSCKISSSSNFTNNSRQETLLWVHMYSTWQIWARILTSIGPYSCFLVTKHNVSWCHVEAKARISHFWSHWQHSQLLFEEAAYLYWQTGHNTLFTEKCSTQQ